MQSDWARSFANYNRLMNERLYEHCAGLSDEARKQDVGAFFKSIHGTLNNHQTHHRGQLTTLLSQRGIDPGVTDLVAFASFAQGESTLSR